MSQDNNDKALAVRARQEQAAAQLIQFLPQKIDRDRYKAFAVAVMRDPALQQCSQASVMLALADCARLGLFPDRNLGHVWLVPFNKNRKNPDGSWTKEKEVTLIPGYQGYIELAMRSGKIASVRTMIVYEGDEWDYFIDENGEHLRHRPAPMQRRGEPQRVYCVARLTAGGTIIEIMEWDEIMAVKSRSKAADSGPWQTDVEMMARKTVVRRARKYWPQSPELAALGAKDDEIDGPISERETMRISQSLTDLSGRVELRPSKRVENEAARPPEDDQEPSEPDQPSEPAEQPTPQPAATTASTSRRASKPKPAPEPEPEDNSEPDEREEPRPEPAKPKDAKQQAAERYEAMVAHVQSKWPDESPDVCRLAAKDWLFAVGQTASSIARDAAWTDIQQRMQAESFRDRIEKARERFA